MKTLLLLLILLPRLIVPTEVVLRHDLYIETMPGEWELAFPAGWKGERLDPRLPGAITARLKGDIVRDFDPSVLEP